MTTKPKDAKGSKNAPLSMPNIIDFTGEEREVLRLGLDRVNDRHRRKMDACADGDASLAELLRDEIELNADRHKWLAPAEKGFAPNAADRAALRDALYWGGSMYDEAIKDLERIQKFDEAASLGNVIARVRTSAVPKIAEPQAQGTLV